MFQRRQRCEAQACVFARVVRRRERREIAVGEREEDDIRGRVIEINGLGRVIQRSLLGPQEMHESTRKRGGNGGLVHAFFANYDEAAATTFAGCPGPVELMAEARADALHQQSHGLARDLDKALHA